MDLSYESYDIIIKNLEHKGLDWHLKTESVYKRRLENLFKSKNITSVDQFLKSLNSSHFINEVANAGVIENTELFRFPDTWNFLRSYFEAMGASHNFSIYLPNCSTGEDIMSLAIIFDMLGFENWHIHADVETEDYLKRAQKLFFDSGKLELSTHNFNAMFDKNLFHRYFSLRDRNYCFMKNIEKKVTYSVGTVYRKNHNNAFEIVYAANILTKYKKEAHRNILTNLYNNTALQGYLILGNLETISNSFYKSMFSTPDNNLPIYQKSK